MRLFRARAWCLATIAALAVATAGASFDALLHASDRHDACCPPGTLVEHDESAHRYQAAGGEALTLHHCVACHWARSFRSGPESTSAAARLDEAGAHAPHRTIGRALAPALTAVPARSPPRFS